MSTDNEQDRRCVAGILNGDTAALGPLFVKYRERIYHICYRVVFNRDDALDLTSEAFLKALRSIATFKKDARFYTWLCRIAVNASIDFLRKKGHRRRVHFDEVIIDESRIDGIRKLASDNPVRNLELGEMRSALADAINDLGEDHRAVFSLYALKDLSYKEIAEIVDCPIGTVMSRLHYARKQLQEHLRGYAK